jgi:hypothetical protein
MIITILREAAALASLLAFIATLAGWAVALGGQL